MNFVEDGHRVQALFLCKLRALLQARGHAPMHLYGKIDQNLTGPKCPKCRGGRGGFGGDCDREIARKIVAKQRFNIKSHRLRLVREAMLIAVRPAPALVPHDTVQTRAALPGLLRRSSWRPGNTNSGHLHHTFLGSRAVLGIACVDLLTAAGSGLLSRPAER